MRRERAASQPIHSARAAGFTSVLMMCSAIEPTVSERTDGSRRLLLMTRYRDLGEWQRSRDPSTEAMQRYRRLARSRRKEK